MSAAKQRITAAEYLAFERQAETKHEFIDGEIIAMAGASMQHILIVGNVAIALGSRLRGRGCRMYPTDLRVKITESGRYVYPDITVVCGTPQLEDDQFDTLLNPTLIVEVLSPSTEAYDRGDKFAHYRSLPSLQEYLLIAQDRVRVERYLRLENNDWLLTAFNDHEEIVPLLAGTCEVPLAEIYALVEFPATGTEREEPEANR